MTNFALTAQQRVERERQADIDLARWYSHHLDTNSSQPLLLDGSAQVSV